MGITVDQRGAETGIVAKVEPTGEFVVSRATVFSSSPLQHDKAVYRPTSSASGGIPGTNPMPGHGSVDASRRPRASGEFAELMGPRELEPQCPPKWLLGRHFQETIRTIEAMETGANSK